MIDPTTVSGCLVCLQADSIVSVANRDLVVASGTTSWTNLGSLGGMFTPNSSGNIYRPNRLNGHATVEISGGRGFSSSISSLPTLTNISAFYVYKLNSMVNPTVNGSGYLLVQTYQPGTAGEITNYAGAVVEPSGYGIYYKSGSATKTYVQFQNDWCIRTDFLIANTSYAFRRNGSNVDFGSRPNLSTIPSGQFQLGYLTNEPVAFSGEFAEILYYDNILSNDDVDGVESYLKNKYFVGGGGGCNVSVNPVIPSPTGLNGCAIWFEADNYVGNVGQFLVNNWNNRGYLAGNIAPVGGVGRAGILGSGLNGHTYLSMSGGVTSGFNTGSLGSPPNNANNNLNSYTAFCVYQSFSDQNQTIFELTKTQAGGIARPYGGQFISSSGMYGYQAPYSPSQTVVGSGQQFLPTNSNPKSWVVRTDIYSSGTNQFRLNQAYIGQNSGSYFNVTTNISTTLIMYIGDGYGNTNVSQFRGNMAEIIIYDHVLSSGEVNQVETYLVNKYALNQSAGASVPLYTSASPIIFNSATIYASGYDPNQLFINPNGITFNKYQYNVNRFNQLMNDSYGAVSFYTAGIPGSSVRGIPVVTVGGVTTGTGVPIYTAGAASILNASMPIYTVSYPNPVSSGYTSIYTNATSPGTFGLYSSLPISLANPGFNASMPIYVQGPPIGYGTAAMPIYVRVNESSGVVSNGVPIFIQNSVLSNQRGMKLYVRGAGGLVGGSNASVSMPVYIQRLPFGTVDIFVKGYEITPSDTILHNRTYYGMMNHRHADYNLNPFMFGSTPLYVKTVDFTPVSSSLPIFVGATPVAASSVNIYTIGSNAPSTVIVQLYTNGF